MLNAAKRKARSSASATETTRTAGAALWKSHTSTPFPSSTQHRPPATAMSTA